VLSRGLIVLLPQSRRGRHAPLTTVALVCQPFQTSVQKTLHPLVDKASELVAEFSTVEYLTDIPLSRLKRIP